MDLDMHDILRISSLFHVGHDGVNKTCLNVF